MSELDEQIAMRRGKRDALARAPASRPSRRASRTTSSRPTVRERWGGGERRGARGRGGPPARARPGARASASRASWSSSTSTTAAAKLQLFVRRDRLDDASRELLEHLDLGDYLLAEGALMRTRTGELSLVAERLTLLAKALRPLPEKWHGLADVEARYRQRYLDLVANPESRRVFEIRAAARRRHPRASSTRAASSRSRRR